jgi:predicted lipoprotein with Yx(FWY)xxD motif
MKRSLPVAAVLGLAALLGACGSDGGGGSAAQPTTAGSAAVTVANVSGVGNVLVDTTGHALYAADEEASGTVLCTGACTSIWKPLAAASGTQTGGAAALAVIDRPDGSKQLTAAGRPLYTFSQDSPGKVSGDGVADDFGGQHLTWHVVKADGSTGSSSTSGGGDSGGYGGY